MKHLIYLLLLVNVSLAQTNSDKIIKYKNGKTKSSVKYKGNDSLEIINYFENGKVKDSAWYRIETFVAVKAEMDKHKGLQDSIVIKNEVGIGTGKKYFKSGNLKSISYYAKNELSAAKTYEYRRNGKLSIYKETPFGIKIVYKKNGKIARYSNINKGTQVYVPKYYKDQKHLPGTSFASRIKGKSASLINAKEHKKIISGALISIRLNSDSIKYNNCFVEGFAGDSIYLSKFEYDLEDTKAKLKYDSTFALHSNQLKSIFYSKKLRKRTYSTATFLEILGMDIIIVPTVVLPLMGGIYALVNPIALPAVISGIPMIIYSRYLFKKMAPKEYKMNEWKIVENSL